MYLHKFVSGANLAKLNSWKKGQITKIRELKGLSENDPLPVGAIGGLYTYSFTPTGIGLVIKVTNNLTQDILDLSDYDDW